MAAKKTAAKKTEPAAEISTASPESPAPPLVASFDQLKEVAAKAAPAPEKKG